MDRQGQDIEISSEDGALAGYLATPSAGHGPGVVVIQEWWGLVDNVRDVCDRLARTGFVALAPDLYRGDATQDADTASRLMMDLEIPRALRDLDAAVSTLRNHHAVEGAKVGCIGFCMGGQLALSAATGSEGIGAAVDCYGIHPNVTVDARTLACPLLGIFAEHDDFIPLERVRELERDLAESKQDVHVEVFPGVQHAFLNDSRPDVFNAEAAERAWNQIGSFLKAELSL